MTPRKHNFIWVLFIMLHGLYYLLIMTYLPCVGIMFPRNLSHITFVIIVEERTGGASSANFEPHM